MFIVVVFLLILLSVSSCHQFVYEKHLMQDYYLTAVDSKNDMSISLRLKNQSAYVGRIEGTVFEVG